ncbi:DNA-3-methyladenine glycosylase I [Alicyclobacillus herbarius]|uniref:DNA-3-methyladenine glycosylase I n=1 Tax=Alicyclobacillus herbarius TaxID=122960 RepID=UPI0004102585|nr:DNA-3-methyladenine glycosylase I [Alicyclobacillus herbarius]
MDFQNSDTDIPQRRRCSWVTTDLLAAYHDDEWGRAPTTDAGWLEVVILETFQAGISWRVVLQKRNAMREVFGQFDPGRLAEFGAGDVERLLSDSRIIRNRRKIEAAIKNARVAVNLAREFGSLENFFAGLTNMDEAAICERLQAVFHGVGATTAQSIAYATGLVPPPHESGCWLASTPSTIAQPWRIKEECNGVKSSKPDDDVDNPTE